MCDPRRFQGLLDEMAQILVEEMEGAVITARLVAPVKSGFLRDHIQMIKIDRDNYVVVAGTLGVMYAIYIEFGYTTRSGTPVPARPFWRPAVWNAFYQMQMRWMTAIGRWKNV